MRLTVASVRRAAERDAYARLRHTHLFGVTYRLAPHDKPPKVVGDATVQIVSGPDTDRSALDDILSMIEQSQWSGSRKMRAEHQWAHVGSRNEGSISKSYLVGRIKRALNVETVTAVVVSDVEGAPTALVLMRVNVRPYDIDASEHFDTRWAEHLSYIDILSSRDNSPGGHPALAMVSAMRHARASGKRIVYLSATDTALAYYLINSFGDGVHAFALGDEDTFELTRRFALSPSHSARDYADIEAAMRSATRHALMPIVGFVLDGKDALAALDYDRLVDGAPPTTEREWLGHTAIFWPVAGESPLVVGRTYDVVLAQHSSMLVADGELTGQHAHTGLHGERWLAGAFVGVHGERNSGLVDSWGAGQMLTFANGDFKFANGETGCYVNIVYRPQYAFRQTTREHALVGLERDDEVTEIVTIREISHLPPALSLSRA
jgi:hypothetical protein